MITVIGLGTERGDVTLRAIEAMRRAGVVLLRSGTFAAAEDLNEAGIPFETLDGLYERSRSFDTLARNLAREVRRRAKEGDVCYCVDGSPSEDRAARLLMQRKDARVIEGVSKGERAAARAGLSCAYQSVSAYEIAGRELTLPLVVYDLTDRALAGDVKLALAERFGDEAPALLIGGGGVREIALYEADRQAHYGADTALVLPEIPLLQKTRFGFEDFMAIMRRLRAPDGCPWDRAQTHASIRINAIEEAYELVDAIDADDPAKMCEEAGDVLMQAAFHALIEEERGGFTVTDMLSGLCEKLITRHTHVFGQEQAAGADGALSVWEKNKMTEKHQKTFSDAVNDVPEGFPALLRAQKIAGRMQKGGWQTEPGALRAELSKKADELLRASGRGESEAAARRMGELLMAVCRLGRAAGQNCEQALLDEAKRAQGLYTAFEALVRADGKDVTALTEGEFRAYCRAAEEQSGHEAD